MTIDDTWTRLVRYAFVEQSLAGRDILEIGAGDGSGAAFLADRAARVVSTDPSAEVVARARMRTTRPNLEFRTIDPFASGLDDRSFDLVCAPSAESWLRDARFLAEVRRLLRPNGLLYVVVPSADRPDSTSGLAYHDFVALLGRAFATVRPLAQTPGVHFTLTEFAPEGEIEPSLDGSLLEDPEPCSHYLALCGDGEVPRPGYSMLLVPRAALREERARRRTAELPAVAPAAGSDPEVRRRLQAAEERVAALEAEKQSGTWAAQERGEDAARLEKEVELLREGARLHEAEAQRFQVEIGDLKAWAEENDRERAALAAERTALAAEAERLAAQKAELEQEVSRRGMRVAELEGQIKAESAERRTEAS
jgi:SAM-dependent methyltransferase